MMRGAFVLLLLLLPAFAGCLGSQGPDGADDPDDTQTPGPEPTGTATGSATETSTDTGTTGPGPDPDPNATQAPDWGDPATRGLRPGIRTIYDGSQCTSSVLFANGTDQYFLASAAHCVASGDNLDVDGCEAPASPPGSRVDLEATGGATVKAAVAYSSWYTMQEVGETNDNACAANDFALIEVPAEAWGKLHPAPLHFDAVTGLAARPTDEVWGYGDSGLRQGQAQAKQGTHQGTVYGGWGHQVYLTPAGVPGDSGGPLFTEDGEALGVLSVIALFPDTGSNIYTDLGKALAYMEEHTGLQVELVTYGDWDPSLF